MQASTKSPVLPDCRGSRFLDLVKQNKLNVSDTKKQQSFERGQDSASKVSAERKTYNPEVSPISILTKRKPFIVPVTPDSPSGSSSKRKRVGFCDPVSVTEEEERLKSSVRCIKLLYEAETVEGEDEELDITKESIIKLENEEYNETQNQEEAEAYVCPQSTSEEPSGSKCDSKLTFKDKAELLDYITSNISVDELFEKLTDIEEKTFKRKELIRQVVKSVGLGDLLNEYFSSKECQSARLPNEQNTLLAHTIGQISNLMEENKKIKHKVIDLLTQQHTEEFLDHTIQSNSTNAVCDKIGISNIVKYLIHKVHIADSDENNDLTTEMNRAMVFKLVNDTQATDTAIYEDRQTIQELLLLLFKNKPNMEIFDTVQEFIRKLLQNK